MQLLLEEFRFSLKSSLSTQTLRPAVGVPQQVRYSMLTYMYARALVQVNSCVTVSLLLASERTVPYRNDSRLLSVSLSFTYCSYQRLCYTLHIIYEQTGIEKLP